MALMTEMGSSFTCSGGESCLVCHQSCQLSWKLMFPWLSIWMSGSPIHLCTWPTACEVSETEPDHVRLRLVVRHPSWIVWTKTCECSAKSVEVSQGSTECVAQNSNQRPQCPLEAAVCLATMLDCSSFCASRRSVQNAHLVAGGIATRALAVDNAC